MNVWLLTHGEYSDYGVTAVLDGNKLEEAEQIAWMTDGKVEGPFLINDFRLEQPPEGKAFYDVDIYIVNGTRDRTEVYKGDPITSHGSVKKEKYRYLENCLRSSRNQKTDKFEASMYADNEEHAAKIANEWLSQVMAGNKPRGWPKGRSGYEGKCPDE